QDGDRRSYGRTCGTPRAPRRGTSRTAAGSAVRAATGPTCRSPFRPASNGAPGWPLRSRRQTGPSAGSPARAAGFRIRTCSSAPLSGARRCFRVASKGRRRPSASSSRPLPDHLMECLGAWEKFLHDDTLPPLVHAALAHSQFEAIHPFLDGNGRVGRLLITLLLIAKDVLPSPLLYLSAFFEGTREEYYARLLGVTERGEWEEWLGYFLTGAAQQAEDALGRIQRIHELLAGWREGLARAPSRLPERALDLFAENLFWGVSKLAARLDVAFTTAQRAIDRLQAAGIVALAGH